MTATLSKRKVLTARWLTLLPELSSVRPLFLLRRHGPLLCGVCLDGSSRPDRYYARAFFHNLAQPFPVISLTGAAAARDERGAAMDLRVDDEAKVASAAQALCAAHAWLTRPALTLAQAASHCADYVEGRFGGVVPFQTGPVELVLHACAWVDRPDLASSVLANARAQMAEWPERAFNIIKSARAWADRFAPLCEPGAGARLRTTTEANAETLKVSALVELPLDAGEPLDLKRRLC